MPTALGDKINTLRRKKGLTLEKLGELTDSSKSYIWELENKNPPRPSADKISKIAAVLGVTAEYLIDPADDVAEADAVDSAFFRKYQKMPGETKEKIRQIIDLWNDSEKK